MRLVLCAEGPVEPSAALAAYLRRQPPSPADPLHLLFGMRRTRPPLPDVLPLGLTVGAFMPGRGLRDVPDLILDRSSYSEICHDLSTGKLAPDVVIACTTPPDAHGVRSLGAIDGYLGLAMRRASVVVEEVGWLPRIPGAALVRDAALVVPSPALADDDQPSFSAPHDAVDRQIARRVLDLLPNRPHLALGIGRVPEAIGDLLEGRGDVSIVTGVVTETSRRLSDQGVLADGRCHGMSVVGSAALLQWAVDHVQLHPSTFIHDPLRLGALSRFVAVLGAVSVDLMGNVNSERSSHGLVSGRGGAPDFAAGAHGSPDGLSIVCLHSHNSQGASRLVESIPEPTIPGRHVDVVVTERGVARLSGLDASERAAAIAALF